MAEIGSTVSYTRLEKLKPAIIVLPESFCGIIQTEFLCKK